MRVARMLMLPVLGAALLPAQKGGCPEGYIPRPGSDSRSPDCIWVGGLEDPEVGEYSTEVPEGMDDFLVAVSNRTYEFKEKLPNYICEQSTERLKSTSNPPKWKRQDRITNELLFVDGREYYRDFLRNGKKLKDRNPMASGLWSTGEFITMALDLLGSDTAAQFEFVAEEEVRGIATRVYDFSVEKANSHWELKFTGQTVRPAYEGSIWIDPERRRVMRLEVSALDLPITYPRDVTEMVADFGLVEIGGDDHLLAITSEVLACRRWKKTCHHNKSKYTNYRMFTAESTVMQTDSTITFEGEAKQK